VEAAIDSLHASIRELRNFIYGLRPETFDGADLPAGIVALGEQFRHNNLVELEVDVDVGVGQRVSPEHGAQLLHLLRESLSNAARHARAGHLTIAFRQAEGLAILSVTDDGVGFDPASPAGAGHQGLANMRARAEAIGGTLRIESAPGKGTRIIVSVPAAVDELMM
jgi:signal transduction histidine kinase